MRWLLPLAAVVVLGAGGYAGWYVWQQQQREQEAQAQAKAVQLKGLEATLDALRRDQRATSQRLQDAATTNRVLRDEMLGLSQRSALLEENVAKLADSANQGRQAVQRDEAELLLTQAAQRLNYADDVDGARRLYAQAAIALADLPDADGLNLRQALVQEREALDALGSGRACSRCSAWMLWPGRCRACPRRSPARPAAAPPSPGGRPRWHRSWTSPRAARTAR